MIFLNIRERIWEEGERASPFARREVDESHFGPRRVRGVRGHGVSAKTIVFGIFTGNGRVFIEIVADCKKATSQAIIRGRVSPEAVIHSDGRRGYDDLVLKETFRRADIALSAEHELDYVSFFVHGAIRYLPDFPTLK